jgi:hypothetical protein
MLYLRVHPDVKKVPSYVIFGINDPKKRSFAGRYEELYSPIDTASPAGRLESNVL